MKRKEKVITCPALNSLKPCVCHFLTISSILINPSADSSVHSSALIVRYSAVGPALMAWAEIWRWDFAAYYHFAGTDFDLWSLPDPLWTGME